MSFLDTLKELAGTVIEAAKENPVAAIGIGAGTLVVGAGGIYAKRRWSGRKAVAAPVAAVAAPVAAITPVAAPEAAPASDEPTLLNEKNQFPDRPQGSAKG